jgi:hypothetical protein
MLYCHEPFYASKPAAAYFVGLLHLDSLIYIYAVKLKASDDLCDDVLVPAHAGRKLCSGWFRVREALHVADMRSIHNSSILAFAAGATMPMKKKSSKSIP